MDIKLINKIEDKVNEYIDATGSNKTWIAKQIGLSKQALYNLFHSPAPTINNLIKLSIILKCKVSDLYDYEIVD
jgi:DNA-binding XRE family transcriptional regulator